MAHDDPHALHAPAKPGEAEQGASEHVAGRFRTTVYLTEQELTLLDELKVHFRRREKRKVDQSQLIREAIRYYRQALLEP